MTNSAAAASNPVRMKITLIKLSWMAGLVLAPLAATAADSPLKAPMEAVGSAYKSLRDQQEIGRAHV